MASPQLENGYTPIANELLEALYRTELTGREWRLIMCIARASYGWSQREAPISIREAAKRLGGKDYSNIKRVARTLVARQILARNGNALLIAKDYDRWGQRSILKTGDSPDARENTRRGSQMTPGVADDPRGTAEPHLGVTGDPMGGVNLTPSLPLNLPPIQGPQPRKTISKAITKTNIRRTPSRRRPASPPDPNVMTVIKAYETAYQERFRKTPVIHWAMYGAHAKQLLAGRPMEEAIWMVREFLLRTPEYYDRKGLYGMEYVVKASATLLARMADREGVVG